VKILEIRNVGNVGNGNVVPTKVKEYSY